MGPAELSSACMGYETTPWVYGPVDLAHGISREQIDRVQEALAEVEQSPTDFSGARVRLRCDMDHLWVIEPVTRFGESDRRRFGLHALLAALARALTSRGLRVSVEGV